MSEHEKELHKLFERGSVKPKLDINPNNARLMTFEAFKLISNILMEKGEYYGKSAYSFDPNRA